MQRVATQWTGNVWLLVVQLRKNSLKKAAFAESMTADGANGLPEWIPTNRAREVSKCGIVNMLSKLAEKILRCFEAANAQSRQSA
jgi:hypothetical protein